jgi:predicted dehydrogenase
MNIAFIGVAGRAGTNMAEILKAEDVSVIALCDVDETHLNSVGANFPAASRFRDFRKLLETEKSLDAVVISTPDLIHAPACMMALKLGRHVYCEKPFTRTVKEMRPDTRRA